MKKKNNALDARKKSIRRAYPNQYIIFPTSQEVLTNTSLRIKEHFDIPNVEFITESWLI